MIISAFRSSCPIGPHFPPALHGFSDKSRSMCLKAAPEDGQKAQEIAFFKCGAQQCFPYRGYVTYIWTITRLMRMSDVAVWSIRTPFREASAISSFLKSACQSDAGSWLEMMRALRLYLSSRICSKSFCCCPSIGFIPKSSMMRTSISFCIV